MKANEAPDKIYVQLPSNKWIGRTWDEIPIKEGDNPNWKNATNIEYVRKDAFIEKACQWIKSNWMKYHWYDPYEDNEGYNGDGLIDDLKKHFEEKV